MKANFNIKKIEELDKVQVNNSEEKKELTEAEFEDYIRKSGSAGSFMVFRSDRSKESELGIDQL